jgi:hypothetical protein
MATAQRLGYRKGLVEPVRRRLLVAAAAVTRCCADVPKIGDSRPSPRGAPGPALRAGWCRLAYAPAVRSAVSWSGMLSIG